MYTSIAYVVSFAFFIVTITSYCVRGPNNEKHCAIEYNESERERNMCAKGYLTMFYVLCNQRTKAKGNRKNKEREKKCIEKKSKLERRSRWKGEISQL